MKLQRVFQETTQDEERRVQRLLGDAASELERGSREASSRENPQQLLAECERSYHQRRQELETEARRNLDRAANEHEEAVRERQKKNRQRERDAFVDYLQRLEQAWAELDPKALDAPALETIAQTLLAAAAAERQSSWSGPPGT